MTSSTPTRQTSRSLSIAAVALLIVAACSTGGSPTPAGQTAAPATPAGPATAEPNPATPAPATPGGSVAADTPAPVTPGPIATASAGGDLDGLIPDEIAGITMEATSMTGQEYLELIGDSGSDAARQFTDLLASLGATIDGVTLVQTSGFGESDYVYVNASRMVGVDANAQLQATVQNQILNTPQFNSGMSATAATGTVGGKPVTIVTTLLGGSVYRVEYFYPYADVVFKVFGSEELIAEALSLLP